MKRKLPILIYYLVLILYLELVYKLFILHNLFSINTLFVILFSMSFIFLLSLISSLFKKRVNYILTIILSSFILLIYLSQYVYYKFYHSIYSVFSVIKGSKQVFGGFSSAIVIMVKNNLFVILLMLIPFILFIIFGKKLFNFDRVKKYNISYLVLFISFILIKYMCINLDKNDIYSLNTLYYKTHAPMLHINKTGLLSMEVMDLERYLFGFKEEINYKINENNYSIVNYNIVDIDYNTLIENETNQDIKNMHNYFNSLEPTNKNEYTGIFKGKNLIYITAEGFDSILIDENLTPTLYKLVNNGFVFNNYYQPLYSISTSDGEYMYMNSLLPKEGVWSFYESSFIDMPYGLGNVFNKLGYDKVNAYHNHTYTFYERDLSHANIGFNYFGCGNGLEERINCNIWPESDKEMFTSTISDYIDSDKFMIYYMSVSGHLDYSFTNNSMSKKNKERVDNLPYSKNVKAYLSANLELEYALEELIKVLESKGKLDDTVIVLSPDHFPYGLTTNELNEISSIDRSDKFDNYKSSLIIYNNTLDKVSIDKYVSSIDVLPTIYNLFGIKYDSRLLIGRDALSTSDGLVILSDRSWINEYGKYNSITKEFIKFKDVDKDYVDNINKYIYGKFSISSMLLYEEDGVYLDYYKRVFND